MVIVFGCVYVIYVSKGILTVVNIFSIAKVYTKIFNEITVATARETLIN